MVASSVPTIPPAAQKTEKAFTEASTTAGETETVRRIVGRLEALPPERARLVASAAYILARAAHADSTSATRRRG